MREGDLVDETEDTDANTGKGEPAATEGTADRVVVGGAEGVLVIAIGRLAADSALRSLICSLTLKVFTPPLAPDSRSMESCSSDISGIDSDLGLQGVLLLYVSEITPDDDIK